MTNKRAAEILAKLKLFEQPSDEKTRLKIAEALRVAIRALHGAVNEEDVFSLTLKQEDVIKITGTVCKVFDENDTVLVKLDSDSLRIEDGKLLVDRRLITK